MSNSHDGHKIFEEKVRKKRHEITTYEGKPTISTFLLFRSSLVGLVVPGTVNMNSPEGNILPLLKCFYPEKVHSICFPYQFPLVQPVGAPNTSDTNWVNWHC